jgi:hypothetical protein
MNASRNGNFTSSEIVALTTFGRAKDSLGKPFFTYIDECNIERRLGRSICNNFESKPTTWGTIGEKYCFDILPLDCVLMGDETIRHPDIENWFGSPDYKRPKLKIVGEIKCPYTLKSFCSFIDLWDTGGIQCIRDHHQDGEKYYWQLISNAVLTGSDTCELTIFCPYESELAAIKELASSAGIDSGINTQWIYYADKEELPYIPDGGYYKNLNIMRFHAPEEDKKFLTERVLEASKKLIKLDKEIA